MFRLRSIGVLSAAKISGLLYGALALLFVPIFAVMAIVMTVVPKTSPEQPSAALFVIFAIAAPFIYGAIGFVTGAIAALIYNLVAGWVGGLELHFDGSPWVQPSLSPVSPHP